MQIIIVLLCLVALVLLVGWAKVNAFVAFLMVSVAAGLLLGIPAVKVVGSMQRGLGDTLGSIAIIVCLGAMLGKLVAASGAAQQIADALVRTVGERYIQWALVATGFIVGITLFYGIGFVLLVPLIFSVNYRYKLPAVYIGLPMLASLSVTHGFLPPHPSPSALVAMFHADMGKTLIYGLIIAVPSIVIAGPLFAQTLKGIRSEPLEMFKVVPRPASELPGVFNSFFTPLLPVGLLMLAAVFPLMHITGAVPRIAAFVGDPAIVMLIGVLVATLTLGLMQGKTMKDIGVLYGDAAKDIAIILLVIGASGAFKQILTDSGVSDQIGRALLALPLPPLLTGWLIAAVIRISLGSSTVAGLTAAGIIAPLVATGHANAELMVLAIGAGSLTCSHVNDSGFWLYKEYFNLSIKDTLRSWTVMESLVSVVGLAGVLLLNLWVR